MQDHLLGADGEPRRLVAGQRDRFVHRVGVQRLGPAHHGGQGLDGHAHEVDLGLLFGQRDAGGLGVEAHQPGTRVLCAEDFAHLPRPDAPRRPELRDLFEEVVVAVEEEGDARGEGIDVEPARDAPAYVFQAIGEREGELLCRRRAGLADVVAADADRVP